jgi:uncharacterized protein (DUF1501 family)
VKIGYRAPMKLFSSLLVTLALSTSAFAQVNAADFDTFMKWFNGLADQVVADQNDCVKMANDINASVAANKAMIDKAKANIQAGQKLTQDQMQRVMQAGQRLAQAIAAKCAQDKNVQAAVMNLPGPRHK